MPRLTTSAEGLALAQIPKSGVWPPADLSPTTPTIFAIFGSGSDTVLQPAVKSKPAYAPGARPLSNTGKLAQPRVHCTAKLRPWSAKAVALIESPGREPGPLDGEKGVTRPIALGGSLPMCHEGHSQRPMWAAGTTREAKTSHNRRASRLRERRGLQRVPSSPP